MKIEFEDGSFCQVKLHDQHVSVIQCARNGKKLVMSTSNLNLKQATQLVDFLSKWVKEHQDVQTA